jgi:hypothetical protein
MNKIRVRRGAIFTAVMLVATAVAVSLPGGTAFAAKSCPKSITVTDPGDSGLPGQLRTAVTEVCDGGKVEISPSLEAIYLDQYLSISVSKNVKISGTGQDIRSPRTVFDVPTGGNLQLTGVTLRATAAQQPGLLVDGVVALRNVTVTGFRTGIVSRAGSSVTLNQGTVITGNIADREKYGGAGIYNVGGTVTLNADASVTGNLDWACFTLALPGGGFLTIGMGGGVYSADGSLTLNDNAVVSDNVVRHCDPSRGFGGLGGGIYAARGSVTLKGSAQVTGNKAATGSGIYGSNATITIADQASVTANGGEGAAGGVRLVGGTLTMTDSANISANISAGWGGGVLNSGLVVLQDVASITNNTASLGGGVYNYPTGTTYPGELYVTGDAVITDNHPDDIYP